MPLVEYLKLARAKLVELLKRGDAHDYPATVATTWELSFQQIESQSPATADLLRLLSFFAPDRIPRWLLTESTTLLPSPLSETVADPLGWLDAIELLRSYSLIEQDDDSVSVHRLVQAVSRDRLSREQQIQWVSLAQKLVLKYFPIDIDTNVAAWPRCGELHDHAEVVSQLADQQSADPNTTATLLNQLARYQQIRANFNAAIVNQRRALSIDEQCYGAEDPKVAISLNNLAQLLQDTNHLAEAEPLIRRALAIDEQSFGPEHPRVASLLNNLAQLLVDTNRLEEAEPLMRRALAIDE